MTPFPDRQLVFAIFLIWATLIWASPIPTSSTVSSSSVSRQGKSIMNIAATSEILWQEPKGLSGPGRSRKDHEASEFEILNRLKNVETPPSESHLFSTTAQADHSPSSTSGIDSRTDLDSARKRSEDRTGGRGYRGNGRYRGAGGEMYGAGAFDDTGSSWRGGTKEADGGSGKTWAGSGGGGEVAGKVGVEEGAGGGAEDGAGEGGGVNAHEEGYQEGGNDDTRERWRGDEDTPNGDSHLAGNSTGWSGGRKRPFEEADSARSGTEGREGRRPWRDGASGTSPFPFIDTTSTTSTSSSPSQAAINPLNPSTTSSSSSSNSSNPSSFSTMGFANAGYFASHKSSALQQSTLIISWTFTSTPSSSPLISTTPATSSVSTTSMTLATRIVSSNPSSKPTSSAGPTSHISTSTSTTSTNHLPSLASSWKPNPTSTPSTLIITQPTAAHTAVSSSITSAVLLPPPTLSARPLVFTATAPIAFPVFSIRTMPFAIPTLIP